MLLCDYLVVRRGVTEPVLVASWRLVSCLLSVLSPAPLHHARPELLPVQPGLVQRVLMLSASLRGAAGGGARHLGRGRQLGRVGGQTGAQPDALTELWVYGHSEL